MANIDTEKFLDFVETQQDKCHHTLARGAKFKVEIYTHGTERGLKFTPCSTMKVRKHTHQFVELVNGMFSQSKSFKVADYSPKTVEASYHLALIDLYLNK